VIEEGVSVVVDESLVSVEGGEGVDCGVDASPSAVIVGGGEEGGGEEEGGEEEEDLERMTVLRIRSVKSELLKGISW